MPEKAWRLILKDGLRFYLLDPSPDVKLLFTTRRSRDNDPDHNLDVRNQLVPFRLDGSLVTMNQTHSNSVVHVDGPGEIKADGCFTTQENLALSVRVADCVPIFVWSEKRSLIGVMHAGRRGTLSKIALRFVEKIQKEGISSHRLRYSLGPSIGKCCYEVGEDVLSEFREAWPEAMGFFSRKKEGVYLDLRAANRFLLRSVGAVEGASLDLCTYCNSKRFYSHRREHGAGRNWGIIVRRSS
ncbi:MAG: peptidoglycan editing factor PgeF [Candidatus Stahlbacteria bacterium]|nr:MAG: peptidoglycan editing factor PgeF [Candidatus Stahlbacteria bacterium]